MADWTKTLEPFRALKPAKQIVGRRTPKTIKSFANRLRKLWKQNPSLSLAQLVTDPFTAEELEDDFVSLRDEVLLRKLEEFHK